MQVDIEQLATHVARVVLVRTVAPQAGSNGDDRPMASTLPPRPVKL
eukprot:CAMPEP_0195078112 /NCGR_PEP_ID=MMETSP0448-20130528/20382_1 /TAXON_ID=66468 /ORGANISM="Heterocapsa triquestra, Strain CCMP 448" /LENGTH=45 /DNA_ID= /DNA_START= /DNA_END= /DNA_ORIENTATION=